jgi:hypothetical protein
LEPRGYLVDADVEAAVHAVLPELQSLKKAARDAALEEIARNPKWHAARVIRRCLCDCRRKLKDSGGEAR